MKDRKDDVIQEKIIDIIENMCLDLSVEKLKPKDIIERVKIIRTLERQRLIKKIEFFPIQAYNTSTGIHITEFKRLLIKGLQND